LPATRQAGPALGVAVASAVLVAAHGSDEHRTATATVSGVCFAVVGLFTRNGGTCCYDLAQGLCL
jgi:hypothetical protein